MFAKANDEEHRAVARPLPALRPFDLLLPAPSVVPRALWDFFQINAASACDLSVCIFLYRDKLLFLLISREDEQKNCEGLTKMTRMIIIDKVPANNNSQIILLR